MRTLTSLACVSLISLLAACGDNQRYDANGNYMAPPNATTEAQRTHSPSPGHSSDDYYGDRNHGRYADGAPYTYDRRGYYDNNGYYVTNDSGLNVPQDMFPPRGMCRVWFTDRSPANQPAVESCNNIKSRVPAGAYVIYGG